MKTWMQVPEEAPTQREARQGAGPTGSALSLYACPAWP